MALSKSELEENTLVACASIVAAARTGPWPRRATPPPRRGSGNGRSWLGEQLRRGGRRSRRLSSSQDRTEHICRLKMRAWA